jgi:hypothetical protein
LQVKFVNHSGKEQILSLVDNTIWNSKNISSLEEQANLQVNQGPFPNVGQDLSFVLTTNDNTKIQNINFQAQVIYHNKYKVPYTQVSNIVTYKIK